MADESEDPGDEVQYHIDVGPEDVADAVLLPGNPERVDRIVQFWDEGEERAHHREYRTVTGSHDDVPISVTSTGIGSP
ncbi:MAG: uridine phosphorylase, partial [Halanaeroarchaeum sp.]